MPQADFISYFVILFEFLLALIFWLILSEIFLLKNIFDIFTKLPLVAIEGISQKIITNLYAVQFIGNTIKLGNTVFLHEIFNFIIEEDQEVLSLEELFVQDTPEFLVVEVVSFENKNHWIFEEENSWVLNNTEYSELDIFEENDYVDFENKNTEIEYVLSAKEELIEKPLIYASYENDEDDTEADAIYDDNDPLQIQWEKDQLEKELAEENRAEEVAEELVEEISNAHNILPVENAILDSNFEEDFLNIENELDAEESIECFGENVTQWNSEEDIIIIPEEDILFESYEEYFTGEVEIVILENSLFYGEEFFSFDHEELEFDDEFDDGEN
jgi:hypothetical protein